MLQQAARYQGVAVERISSQLRFPVSRTSRSIRGNRISHRLQQGLSIGYGYTAIIVAWMSQLNPLVIPFCKWYAAALSVGGDQVQMIMGLPQAMGTVMQGLILFPIIAGSLFTEYRLLAVKDNKSNCSDRNLGVLYGFCHSILTITIRAGTSLTIATIGEIFTERNFYSKSRCRGNHAYGRLVCFYCCLL